jgi:hypothetical protein
LFGFISSVISPQAKNYYNRNALPQFLFPQLLLAYVVLVELLLHLALLVLQRMHGLQLQFKFIHGVVSTNATPTVATVYFVTIYKFTHLDCSAATTKVFCNLRKFDEYFSYTNYNMFLALVQTYKLVLLPNIFLFC